MTYKDIDWPYIKVAGLWFLASTLVVTSCWYASSSYMKNKKDILTQANRQNKNIRRQISLTKQDIVTILRYRKDFHKLQKEGLIGDEHRMAWVSGLQNIASSLKIKSAKYRLSAQKQAKPDLVNTRGLLKVLVSRMKLSLELPHEAELLKVFSALKEQPGHFNASNCTIKRSFTKFRLLPGASNLMVSCALDWYSLNTNSVKGARNE